MTFKDTIDIIDSIVTTLGIVVAGGWALWKFVIQKESSPRIEFSVDADFVITQRNHWIIEIIGNLENKGQVPYKITNLSFDTRYLLGEDDLTENERKFNGQVEIPNPLMSNTWLPSNPTKSAILHPGIKMRYNYIYKIPTSASVLLIHGILDYGTGLQTRADRLLKVPYAGVNK